MKFEINWTLLPPEKTQTTKNSHTENFPMNIISIQAIPTHVNFHSNSFQKENSYIYFAILPAFKLFNFCWNFTIIFLKNICFHIFFYTNFFFQKTFFSLQLIYSFVTNFYFLLHLFNDFISWVYEINISSHSYLKAISSILFYFFFSFQKLHIYFSKELFSFILVLFFSRT